LSVHLVNAVKVPAKTNYLFGITEEK